MRLEEFEYIFAPEQARECLPIFDELGHITLIGHSHLCKVFALTQVLGRGAAADRLRTAARSQVHRQRRLGRANRATTTTAPATRCTTPTKKRFEFKRVEYDIETAADKVLRAKLERNFAHRLFIGV